MALQGSLGDVNIEAIDKDIIVSAQGVYVYDTRLDSDGGAWRLRTKHTSWYNETLNTATRGSRREFPVVALIVTSSATGLNDPQFTIYDADDPDLPMWMVFLNKYANGGSDQTAVDDYYASGPYTARRVVARNGVFAEGTYRPSGHINNIVKGVTKHYFIEDASYMITDEGVFKRNGNLGNMRNTEARYTTILDSSGRTLGHSQILDLDITVTPNAKINPATGLPEPTIAASSAQEGINIIHDTGLVTYRSSSYHSDYIKFNDAGTHYYWMTEYSPSPGHASMVKYSKIHTTGSLPAFGSATDAVLANPYWAKYRPDTAHDEVVNTDFGGAFYGGTHTISNALIKVTKNAVGTRPGSGALEYGLTKFDQSYGALMTAYINNRLNTGWMVGKVLFAGLSDTTTGDINALSYITIGGWSSTADTSIGISGEEITLSITGSGSDKYTFQTVSLAAGVYTFSVNVTGNTGDDASIRIGTSGGNSSDLSSGGNIFGTGVQSHSFTLTSTQSVTITLFYNNSQGTSNTWENAVLREGVIDHSWNKSCLEVHSLITRTAVATGADLVGYGNFSPERYLRNPKPVMESISANDNFCVMGWAKVTNDGTSHPLVGYGSEGVNNGFLIGADAAGINIGILGLSSFTSAYIGTGPEYPSNIWFQICYVRRGGQNFTYIDGTLRARWGGLLGTHDFSTYWSTNPVMTFGKRAGTAAGAADTTLALWRVFATAPSDEQIHKMYTEEVQLFADNAKATFFGDNYGVSDLDYDEATDLLHVCTAAGRSVFSGLTRVDNDDVYLSINVSAVNGLVAGE